MYKKIIAICLIFTILIINPYTVKADVASDIYTYYDTFVKDNVWDINKWENFMTKALQDIGFITSGNSGGHAFSISKQVLEDKFPNSGIDSNSNVNDVKNWFNNHIIVSQNNVSVDNDYRQFITNYVNYDLTYNNLYCYTWSKTELSSFVPYVNAYVDLDSVFNDNPNCVFLYWKNGTDNIIGVLSLNDHPYLVCINRSELNNANNERNVLFYEETTRIVNWDKVYKFDTSSQKWVDFPSGIQMNNNGNNIVKILNVPQQYNRSYPFLPLFSKNSIGLRYFFNVDQVTPQSILYQPYYYNDSVYQDFSNSSGDYIFSPSNVNTISYGDTTTYIDSFNREEGAPPTIPQINNYIMQQNEQNVNNGGGSGGGSGDGSGGSGDGIGSIGDVFGWLKHLGSFIASLIKGIGEFLTEIIGGLVDAITDILSGISSLISNVTELLPTAFMDFLSACFSWMPSEWIGLISASLLFMLLWGIIKTIRGN